MKKLAAVVISLATAGLAATPVAATDANGNHEGYAWIIGATTPADTAAAHDGSTVTMSGRGMLMAGPGATATGGGGFSKSDGAKGTWKVTGIDSFVSYGAAGPKFPPGFTGGEAKLRVALSDGTDGTLTIICVLGSPPQGKMEGIQVILGTGGEFTDQAGGNNVFVHIA